MATRIGAFDRRGGGMMIFLLFNLLRTLTKVHSRISCAEKITSSNNYRHDLRPRRHHLVLATKLDDHSFWFTAKWPLFS